MESDRSTGPHSKLAALAAALLIAAVLTACGAPPPAEQQILETLAKMEAALEAGEVGDFLDPIADDFIAENGGLDRRSLALLVRRERMARDRIAITRTDPSVELHGETRATARFNALATGGSGLLPDEGQLWSIETAWRLDDGEWTLISAGWRRAFGVER